MPSAKRYRARFADRRILRTATQYFMQQDNHRESLYMPRLTVFSYRGSSPSRRPTFSKSLCICLSISHASQLRYMATPTNRLLLKSLKNVPFPALATRSKEVIFLCLFFFFLPKVSPSMALALVTYASLGQVLHTWAAESPKRLDKIEPVLRTLTHKQRARTSLVGHFEEPE